MEVEYTCPLGHTCEEAKDSKIYRCRWFVKLVGKDPQSEEHFDEFRCSLQWAPLLAVEQSLFERQTGAAVESMRNETGAGVQMLVKAVAQATTSKKLGDDNAT